MELSEFVATTLAEIQKGVSEAIARTSGTKGAINPCFGGVNDIGPDLVQKVMFDVAVTVSEKATKGGAAGIQIAVLRGNVEGSSAEESSRVSRVQFSIPIIPPVQTVSSVPKATPGREALV